MNVDFVEHMFWSFNQFTKPDTLRVWELTGDAAFQQAGRIMCADGYSVSIQASEYNYCEPRKSFFDPESDQGNFFEMYTSFELGFPNMADDLLSMYAENPDDQCDSVFGYVPKELITALIAKHGGLVHVVDGEIVPIVPALEVK